MDKDAKQRAEERRSRITFVREGRISQMEEFDWEYIQWWRKQSALDKISAAMEIIHTSYAIKGIDVTQRRLQRFSEHTEQA